MLYLINKEQEDLQYYENRNKHHTCTKIYVWEVSKSVLLVVFAKALLLLVLILMARDLNKSVILSIKCWHVFVQQTPIMLETLLRVVLLLYLYVFGSGAFKVLKE